MAIRTRDPLAQNDIITPVSGKFIPTQADRCPYPGCRNTFPHQHSSAEAKILPSINEYRKAGEAIRERWSEKQRRIIAENEAVLRQLADIRPEVGNLSLRTHLPRGNDLKVQEQIAVIHGGATPAQYEAMREMLLERHRQDIIDNTSPITPISSTDSYAPQIKGPSQNQAGQTSCIEWNDFPELDAKYGTPPTLYPTLKPEPMSPTEMALSSAITSTHKPLSHLQNTDFLNTYSPLCTGPCPIRTPHNQGAYLQQGQVPRMWNARWGYSDPPREIWEAWVRIEQGCGRSGDEVVVDAFALSHWWAGA